MWDTPIEQDIQVYARPLLAGSELIFSHILLFSCKKKSWCRRNIIWRWKNRAFPFYKQLNFTVSAAAAEYEPSQSSAEYGQSIFVLVAHAGTIRHGVFSCLQKYHQNQSECRFPPPRRILRSPLFRKPASKAKDSYKR